MDTKILTHVLQHHNAALLSRALAEAVALISGTDIGREKASFRLR